MTRRDRFLLGAMLPVLVLAGIWFLLLSPKRDEAQKLDTDIAAAHSRLTVAQGDVIRYEAARQRLSKNMLALGSAGRAVPASASVATLLRQLERTAHRAGIDLEAISTKGQSGGRAGADAPTDGAAEAPGIESLDLTLSLEGRFFAVEGFLARVDRFIDLSRADFKASGRLLSITELELSPAEGGGLMAVVQASVYMTPDIAALLPATPEVGEPAAPGDSSDANGTLATAGVSP